MFPDLKWDEPGWYSYADAMMLNLAYRKRDYKKAKEYANKSKIQSAKVLCAKTWLSFWMYCFMNTIKSKIMR